jgi:chromodomain-helicase-DNA-binding protein 7
LSTIDHWKTIAETWTFMNVVVYHDRGGAEGRQKIRECDWFYTDITNKGTVTTKQRISKFNLMITTYEVFNSDVSFLKEVAFQFIVIDEAHRLKNASTKTLNLLKEHPCRRVMLLTGTPVQNNTKELFTLLNYIEHEKFNSYDRFMKEYGEL